MCIPTPGTIYCGDCLDYMRGLPDKCVDWVITDPPYGIDAPNLVFSAGAGKGRCRPLSSLGGNADWDKFAMQPEHFAEIDRIAKHWALFGANYFNHLLPSGMRWIVWDKCNGEPDHSQVELICVSRPGSDRIIRQGQNAALKQHPTAKPERLMFKLIDMLCKPGEFVFDPFGGSGTTAVAAERHGHPWAVCEIDPHYCDVIEARTAQRGLALELS